MIKLVKRAVAAGGKLTRPVENRFFADRAGEVMDPFGYRWHISTHIEDVTPAKLKKRMAEMFGE